ncbi:MAG: hypothetical protein KA144_00165 [Xanthomonadaceae bacterium]|nr:hypothetical protein [Xanthomonadaceae bacterium]
MAAFVSLFLSLFLSLRRASGYAAKSTGRAIFADPSQPGHLAVIDARSQPSPSPSGPSGM